MTPRNITAVLADVIGLVPQESPWTGLLAELHKIRLGIPYCPPECMGGQWRRIADVLEHYLPDPAQDGLEPWQQKLSDVITGRCAQPEKP
jgi:hypothetical protein